MTDNKKLNKCLSLGMLICFLAAFIIAVAAKMYNNNFTDYVADDTRLKPNWAAAAPFLVLSIAGLILGLVKVIRFIKVNKNGLKGNTTAIVALIVEISFVILALFACISLALLTKIEDIDPLKEYEKLVNGDLKCVAPIVTSVLAFAFAGVDCGLSFGKLDK